MNVVGKSITALDVKDKSRGYTEYVTDMQLPGMLVGKVLRSPLAHAIINSIDTSEAEKLPGVKAVITYNDCPGIPFGLGFGQEDWTILAKDKVRFVGDEVAAVAAIDEETALRAVSLIKVDYEVLPHVVAYKDALNEGAPVLHDEYPDNIAFTFKIERGDVDEAFERADLVVEGTYRTSQNYQAYLEPMAGIAKWDSRQNLTMWLPIQIPYKIRMIYGKALGISPGKIRVIKPAIGGAFGAKFEYPMHLVAAILAKKTGRPVKMVNTREEDMEAGNPRVPMEINVQLALTKEGKFIGKKSRLYTGNGARTVYGVPITSTATYRIDALYDFGNVRGRADLIYTNTAPTGCMRGFGNSQMTTAMELLVDEAAQKLGMDPMDIRLKNAFNDGDLNVHGWKINTCGLQATLDKIEEMCHWKDRKEQKSSTENQGTVKKGMGLASCMHVSGNRPFFRPFDGASSIIRIGEAGQIILVHAECDMGQGQDTAFAQLACEVLGASFDDIEVAMVDTQISSLGLGSFATRGTVIGGNGVINAAQETRKVLMEAAAKMLDRPQEELDSKNSYIIDKKTGEELCTFGEVGSDYAFSHGGMTITGVGYYVPPTVLPDKTYYGNISPVYPYGTHVAEVEIDTDTGHIQVSNYWAVHDVGKVINPVLLEGQLEGGVAQGIGWALMEDMYYNDQGHLMNSNFLDYRIPGAKDLPPIQTGFVETNDPNGPFGAKGIGEPALNPVAAAVLNAIHDAVGIRFYEIPVTPEKLRKALKENNLT